MKGIYLGAFKAKHDNHDIVYQDINGKRDLPGSIEQRQDFTQHGWVIKYNDMDNKDHQGGFNVHNVIETFLQIIGA